MSNRAPLSNRQLQVIMAILREKYGQDEGEEVVFPNGIARSWIQVIDEMYRKDPCEREKPCLLGCNVEPCPPCRYVKGIFIQVRTALRKDPSINTILDKDGFTLDERRYLKDRIAASRNMRGREETQALNAERMARAYPDWLFARRDALRSRAAVLSRREEIISLEQELWEAS